MGKSAARVVRVRIIANTAAAGLVVVWNTHNVLVDHHRLFELPLDSQ